MSQTIRDLEAVRDRIDSVIDDMNGAPEKSDIIELIRACETLDKHYKEYFCEENDMEEDLPKGTTYNDDDGEMIEYYLEAGTWHTISKILRNLRGE